jgi:hypothetical protein
MAITSIAEAGPTDMDNEIDLRAHRLGELVRALTGCSSVRAEMEVAHALRGSTPVSPDQALETVARAIVRVRPVPELTPVQARHPRAAQA